MTRPALGARGPGHRLPGQPAVAAALPCPALPRRRPPSPKLCVRVTAPPRRLVEAGRAFEGRAAQVLLLGRDGVSFAHTIDVEELEPLLQAADRLCLRVRQAAWFWGRGMLAPALLRRAGEVLHVAAAALLTSLPAPLASPPPPAPQLESLPILQGMLVQFRQWEGATRALTQEPGGGPLCPSSAALQRASGAARSWPITSQLRRFVDETVTKTGAPAGWRLPSCGPALEHAVVHDGG